jgi:hypothetical protein
MKFVWFNTYLNTSLSNNLYFTYIQAYIDTLVYEHTNINQYKIIYVGGVNIFTLTYFFITKATLICQQNVAVIIEVVAVVFIQNLS